MERPSWHNGSSVSRSPCSCLASRSRPAGGLASIPGWRSTWAAGRSSRSTPSSQSTTTWRESDSIRPSPAPTGCRCARSGCSRWPMSSSARSTSGRWHLAPVPDAVRAVALVVMVLVGAAGRAGDARQPLLLAGRAGPDRARPSRNRPAVPMASIRHPGYLGMIVSVHVQRPGARIVARRSRSRRSTPR